MTTSGEDIKAARKRANLTLKQVASLYDYAAPATAWHWEKENWKRGIGKEPPQDILSRIGKAAQEQSSATAEQHEILNERSHESVEAADYEGVPNFGHWLRDEREAAKLTVNELATRSGVTLAQIYNIESGRTLNPQEATKNRLAGALDQIIPNDVRRKTEDLQKIEGLGSLIDFDPYDTDQLPQKSGVYVFYDVSQRPVYVGKAGDISARLKSHMDRFWYKRPIVEVASYIEVPDPKLMHQLEQVLIKFMKSNAVLNKQSVNREDTE